MGPPASLKKCRTASCRKAEILAIYMRKVYWSCGHGNDFVNRIIHARRFPDTWLSTEPFNRSYPSVISIRTPSSCSAGSINWVPYGGFSTQVAAFDAGQSGIQREVWVTVFLRRWRILLVCDSCKSLAKNCAGQYDSIKLIKRKMMRKGADHHTRFYDERPVCSTVPERKCQTRVCRARQEREQGGFSISSNSRILWFLMMSDDQ